MKTDLQILTGARKLIASGWTKGAGARRADGVNVHSLSDQATCWCLRGAMQRASDFMDDDYLAQLLGFEDIHKMMFWNDDPYRSHEEVLARFDEAIARHMEKTAD